MNGEIFDLATMVTYGNRYFRDGTKVGLPIAAKDGPFPGILARKFFKQGTSDQSEILVAEDIDDWFVSLGREPGKRLWLVYDSRPNQRLPEHIASAFANGGGVWWIGGQTGDKVRAWTQTSVPRHYTDYEVAKNWPAYSTYGWVVTTKERDEFPLAVIPPQESLDDCIASFDHILVEVTQFTVAAGWEDWKAHFDRARACLSGSKTDSFVTSNKVVPPGFLNPKAVWLLNACSHAWFFGGMGSWNDCWPSTDELVAEYRRLTPILYGEICRSIVASVNS